MILYLIAISGICALFQSWKKNTHTPFKPEPTEEDAEDSDSINDVPNA